MTPVLHRYDDACALRKVTPGMAQASLSTGSRSHLLPASRGTRTSLYIARFADAIRSCGYTDCRALKFLHCLQHFIHMPRYFQLAPFPAQYALVIDQEGAALNAHHLAAIHILFLDNIK